MWDVDPIIPFGRRGVEDGQQLAEVCVTNVLLDLCVGEVVEAVVHGHVRVRFNHQRRRPRCAVLQPDLLVGCVKSAAPSAGCFQPHQARGIVCVKLQSGKTSASSILENGPYHASSGDQSAEALCFVVFNLQQRVQRLVRDLQPSAAGEDTHVGVGAGRVLKLRRRHAGGEDCFRARGHACDLQRTLSSQAAAAARQRQQSIANPGSNRSRVQTFVRPAGRVDGEPPVHSRPNAEEGFSGGHAEQSVVGVVFNPGAAAAANQRQPVEVVDTLFTETSAGRGLPSKAVTLESTLMTCRFRFCSPVSVVMGAKAASAAD